MSKEFNIGGRMNSPKPKKKTTLSELTNPTSEKLVTTNQSLINASIDNFKKPKRKSLTKKVNTKIPSRLVFAFMMYCAQENAFQKDVFPEMLSYLLEKYEGKELELRTELNGVQIDFDTVGEQQTITLEIFPEQLIKVKEFKIKGKVKYHEIYSQAILQFLHEKQFKLPK